MKKLLIICLIIVIAQLPIPILFALLDFTIHGEYLSALKMGFALSAGITSIIGALFIISYLIEKLDD